MKPALFHFEWLGRTWIVTAYMVGFILAAVALVGVSLFAAYRRGGKPLARTVVVCLLVGMPSALIGGRLLYWATNRSVYADHPDRLFSFGLADFSMFGGLALTAMAILATCAALRTNAWSVADALTPGTALAIAALKLGCFLNGCCCGTRCDHSWGVTFPHGSPAHLQQIRESGGGAIFLGPRPVHPAQLYEVAAAHLIAVASLVMLRCRLPAGRVFLVAAMIYSVARLLITPIRPVDATFAAPAWLFPSIYVLLFATCAICWWLPGRARRDPSLTLTA